MSTDASLDDPLRVQQLPELLIRSLTPNRDAASALALAWGVTDDPAWSPIDLVIQNRRIAAARGDELLRKTIDATVAQAWRLAAIAHCGAEQAISGPQSLRGLALLTEYIPSPDIHGGLFSAILELNRGLKALEHPDASRRALAATLVPAWFKTLDKASRAQMLGVMRNNVIFSAGDYFAGFGWAWRFGIDRAADYIDALKDALPAHARLPLPGVTERDYFVVVIAQSLPQSPDAGFRDMVHGIFHALRAGPTALEGWAAWLAGVFARLPYLNWLDDDEPSLLSVQQVAGSNSLGGRGKQRLEEADPLLVG